MSLEQKVNYQLNKYPFIKKIIKRVYQVAMYNLSDKVKVVGNVKKLSPDDSEYEYFFGYYDKSPWDKSGRYVLCIKCKDTWKDVSPHSSADIMLIDTQLPKDNKDYAKKIASTKTWNVQQGCMLQWLGPDYSEKIIYNDYRNEKYCSVILNLKTKEEKIINFPVYSVAAKGDIALSLDFSRLYNLRPGYGYYNVEESTKGEKLPDSTAVWLINLDSGRVDELLSYKDFANFKPRKEMQDIDAVHKVNHIMISPNGKRFMILYRWFNGQRKYTRLITCDINGENMYLLSDDDMVSHCYWRDDNTILAFENKRESGTGYYLMKDGSDEYKKLWSDICNDGHPSYSADKKYVVTDSYPDRARKSSLTLLDEKDQSSRNVLAKVYAPFKYDNDTRCDLHPRWNHQGDKIAFDAVFEGQRGLYYVDVPIKQENRKQNIVFVVTACKKSGPIEQMLSIFTYIDKSKYNLFLITLYDEPRDGSSQLARYIEQGVKHYRVPLSKKDIILGKTENLRKMLESINADLVHSLGVFPDYALSRMGYKNHVLTIRNFIYEDYPAKFGKWRGLILAKLHLYAMKKANKVWACSASLKNKYKLELGLDYDFIQNGVNLDKFKKISSEEKRKLRMALGIPIDKKVFIYAGQFVSRKNQKFLLEVFDEYSNLNDCILLLLGDGIEFEKLNNQYKHLKNVIFTGNVNNVSEYLQASDVYISSSKSEGLPNGVLEAMATGLPVILSDIEQHKEIYVVNNDIGELYISGNKKDCMEKILSFDNLKIQKCSDSAYHCVNDYFSAQKMSYIYQNEYDKVILGEHK